MKKITTIIALLFLILSCADLKKNKTDQETLASLQSVEVEIEGMTCEIGCAKLIQSKLYKTDGIHYAKISFESGGGQITYNPKKISTEDVVARINAIAGGDLYKVKNSNLLTEVILKD